MRTKHFKNYISIFAIVDYWNWLDASPSLKQAMQKGCPPTGFEPKAAG